MPLKSDPSLKRLYNKYNRLYFEGSLPNAVVWWEPVASAYANCTFEDDVWKIRINPALYGWTAAAKMALLHEMAHVKLHPDASHSDTFNAEMLRLAVAGAFNGIW